MLLIMQIIISVNLLTGKYIIVIFDVWEDRE